MPEAASPNFLRYFEQRENFGFLYDAFVILGQEKAEPGGSAFPALTSTIRCILQFSVWQLIVFGS